jgi:hypothetical protein
VTVTSICLWQQTNPMVVDQVFSGSESSSPEGPKIQEFPNWNFYLLLCCRCSVSLSSLPGHCYVHQNATTSWFSAYWIQATYLSCGPLHPSCAKATTSPAISSTHLADVEADGYSVVKPTASTSTKGIEDTDDDVLWIQWPSSDELEAVGHRDAGDRSIDRSIEEVDSCWLSG